MVGRNARTPQPSAGGPIWIHCGDTVDAEKPLKQTKPMSSWNARTKSRKVFRRPYFLAARLAFHAAMIPDGSSSNASRQPVQQT